MAGAKNATIGALRVSLGLNSAEFETGLKNAQSSLAGFGASAQKSLNGAAKNTKALQAAGLNLSRQFTDIGVSLAGGGSPFLVLTQQLPQVADAFAVAKQQGLGFGDVVKGLLGGVARFAPLLLGVGAAVGAVVGGFTLFERAVDKETKHATTFGDTWKATVHVIGAALEKGPIGKGLKFIGAAFDAAMSAITTGVLSYLDRIVGHFGAAFQLVVKSWRRLPEVFGVIVQGAANLAISAVEGLVNGVIGGINYLLKKAGKDTIGLVQLPRIKVANAELAKDYDKTAASIAASFKKSREGLFGDIVKQADKEYEARQKAKKGALDHAGAEKKVNDELERYRDLVKSTQEDLATQGLDSTQQTIRALGIAVSELLAKGTPEASALAEELTRLRGEYLDLAPAIEKATVEADDFSGMVQDLPKAVDYSTGSLKDLEYQLGEVAAEFYSVQDVVDQIFYGFKNHDWVAAVSGLIQAINKVKDAQDKLAAVAGVASAVGGAVGGAGGAALKGAASGALAGAQIGKFVPIPGGALIGAGIGAVIGGLGGLFGASKAKKKAKKAAAEQARLEAERKAAEEAATKRELEIQLLELSGKAVEAQAAREEDLLKTLSPANQELQKQVFALQHEAEARAAAAALASQQRDLERQLADASGDAAAALKLLREDELAQLPEALRPAKQAIYNVVDATNALAKAQEEWAAKVAAADAVVADARSALADAAAAEVDRLQGVIDRLADIGKALSDFNRELVSGFLSPRAQQAFTLSQFNALAGKTDPASLAALPDAGKALIEAAKATAPNRAALNAVIAKVSQQVSQAQASATSQLTAAQEQLAALHAQTDVLLGIKAGVLNVADGIAGLAAAVAAQQAVLAQQAAATADLAANVAAASAAAQATIATVTAPANPPGAANANAVQQTLEDNTALLTSLVVSSNATAAILEDVTRGGLTLNTVVAA